ncbi:hypothetical protein FKN11_24430 [Vibrio sp. 2-2(7)]|uniref:hypothetical protein n=1 Tax=Vibrio sp. 2-2(7) TaxID=2591013 RepID=UPI0014828CB4|nr:hypothetical protein [Vibrio sp. 2-2(7)]NNN54568.1 hypothetical protein [Vibrio sp. 2-2(7)]
MHVLTQLKKLSRKVVTTYLVLGKLLGDKTATNYEIKQAKLAYFNALNDLAKLTRQISTGETPDALSAKEIEEVNRLDKIERERLERLCDEVGTSLVLLRSINADPQGSDTLFQWRMIDRCMRSISDVEFELRDLEEDDFSSKLYNAIRPNLWS